MANRTPDPEHIYLSYNPDGSTSVLQWRDCEHSNLQNSLEQFGMTEYIYIGQLDVSKTYIGWVHDYPISAEDCNSYKIENKELVFCKIKSKNYHINKLREPRLDMLSKLDIQFMRNLEQGKDTSEVIRQKNILRDMPNNPIWDSCETLDDFKNVTLEAMISTTIQ